MVTTTPRLVTVSVITCRVAENYYEDPYWMADKIEWNNCDPAEVKKFEQFIKGFTECRAGEYLLAYGEYVAFCKKER